MIHFEEHQMGTITKRKNKKGITRYTAQIRKKQDGKVVVNLGRTFDKQVSARAWVKKVEAEIANSESLEGFEAARIGQVDRPDTTGVAVIDAYLSSLYKKPLKTKLQTLEMIKRFPIAKRDWRMLTTSDFMKFGKDLLDGVQPDPIDIDTATVESFSNKPRKPQTVGNILSHMKPVLEHGSILLGVKLPFAEFDQARNSMKHMGLIRRSERRDRRPTIEELNTLMQHFFDRYREDRRCVPMHMVVLYQIYGCNRLDECTRARRDDYDLEKGKLLIRDMKHPSKKEGNNVVVRVIEEQALIIKAMPHQGDRFFPYHKDTISRLFTQACHLCGIDDLHFHDLRHEGISRLFEIGLGIPAVAEVSGHRSWPQLQRYTHLEQSGDKFEGWIWMERLRRGELMP
jgi:integrase